MDNAANKTEQHKKAVLLALEKSLGVVTTACKSAGVGRTAFYEWLKEDAAFKAAVDDIGEVAVDFGESQLHKLMHGYTVPDTKVFINGDTKEPIIVPTVKHIGPDATSVIFYLKTKGKHRGYIPSRAVDITTGGKPLSARELTDEDLARIATGH
jgi:hypothetical protein